MLSNRFRRSVTVHKRYCFSLVFRMYDKQSQNSLMKAHNTLRPFRLLYVLVNELKVEVEIYISCECMYVILSDDVFLQITS